ncbi:glycosyltransferase family 1 protein, partial [Xylella fastidiosa subsp. multiplex]|nr:glycosyltransferase family 1 protein [Xylella fastidiosa subsp. multiplex]
MPPIQSRLTYTHMPHRIITISQHLRDLLIKPAIQPTPIGIVPPITAQPPWMDTHPEHPWPRLHQTRHVLRTEPRFNDNDIIVGRVPV